MPDKLKHFYEFENFRLDAENPSLWRGDELVSISPKALETLIILVEKQGEIVSRDELLDAVWKDTFVEEGNINYTISLLRKTLGNKDLIQTVSRHGYRFTASVKKTSQNGKSSAETSPTQLNSIVEKNPFRWILASIFLVSILFLTSLALWQRSDNIPKSSNISQTQNDDAMKAYTRGKMILEDRDTKNRAEKAMDEFQKAVTLDPTLALAHAGLAQSFFSMAVETSGTKSADLHAKAKISVKKALELDENLAEAYLVRGSIERNFDWDWKSAENDFRRAISLQPDYASAHLRLAQLLSSLGRNSEAISAWDRAYEIDSESENILTGHFSILESAGKYDEGLKLSLEALQANKENIFAKRAVATFLYHTKDYAKVIEICEQLFAANPNKKQFAMVSLASSAYYQTGETEKSSALLQELETQSLTDTKPLYSLAVNYAELGRLDEAIAALQKCFDEREDRMMWLNVEPRFANLRGDSRFQELLKKMRFSD
ncbi:hypothetical protein BH10ACI1_BH10ACI1_11680 [soil metagenome]